MKVLRKEIDESKKEIVIKLQEQFKMQIFGIIEKLKEVDSPEKGGYVFNHFVYNYKTDEEKLEE